MIWSYGLTEIIASHIYTYKRKLASTVVNLPAFFCRMVSTRRKQANKRVTIFEPCQEQTERKIEERKREKGKREERKRE